MLSLGEKRFVAIVQVDGEQFLLGGSATQVALLAKLEVPSAPPVSEAISELPQEPSFAEIMTRVQASAQVSA